MSEASLILGITTGVISGILVYVLISIAGIAIKKIVLPWYSELIYKGSFVEGRWTSKVVEDNEPDAMVLVDLSLNQRAHDLSGVMTVTILGESKIVLNYDVKGIYWGGWANLRCLSIDNTELSQGCMLLKHTHNGALMDGGFVFRNAISEQVEHVPIAFKREKA